MRLPALRETSGKHPGIENSVKFPFNFNDPGQQFRNNPVNSIPGSQKLFPGAKREMFMLQFIFILAIGAVVGWFAGQITHNGTKGFATGIVIGLVGALHTSPL